MEGMRQCGRKVGTVPCNFPMERGRRRRDLAYAVTPRTVRGQRRTCCVTCRHVSTVGRPAPVRPTLVRGAGNGATDTGIAATGLGAGQRLRCPTYPGFWSACWPMFRPQRARGCIRRTDQDRQWRWALPFENVLAAIRLWPGYLVVEKADLTETARARFRHVAPSRGCCRLSSATGHTALYQPPALEPAGTDASPPQPLPPRDAEPVERIPAARSGPTTCIDEH
jgi:hypothetical protein